LSSLTHFDSAGNAVMVDVTDKAVTDRVATAAARITMQPATLATMQAGTAKKGDVLGTARLAGIMAAKRTAELIPLCHPLRTLDSSHRSHHRPHRRGNGGADCRFDRGSHDLRHVQIHRPRHAHRWHPRGS
jgi:hypothetical protein